MVTVLSRWADVAAPRLSVGALLLGAMLGQAAHAADELTISIVPGDTLIGISQRLLQEPRRWSELKRLNHLSQDRRLQPGASLRIPMDWLRWSERTAEVIHVQGVVSGSVSGTGGPLAAGMQLKAGDSFDTGISGAVTLKLPDGSTVVFPPHTQATVAVLRQVPGTQVRATTIELKSGSADSTVPPLKEPASRFEIRTPRVVTAVRGTRFQVTAEGDASRHEVLSGVVAVGGASGSASVKASEGLRAEGGTLGAVVPLLPAADVSGLPLRIERTAQSLTVPSLAGAKGWRWQVAADAGFIQLLQDERTTDPTWLLTSLPDADYFLRVRAADGQGLEGQEAQRAFALRARPEPPLLMSPAADASVQGVTALVWAELLNAPGYHVQVARDAKFTDFVLNRDDVMGASGNRLFTEAAWVPGTYYWRVATLRTAGGRGPFADGPRGPFGDSAMFTLLPASAMAPPEVGEGGLKLAWSGPAGFSHRVQVSADAGFGSTVHDEVVPGAHLDLATPPPGVYFVRTHVVLPGGRAGTWSSAQRFEVPRKHPWGWLLLLPLLLSL
jgi:hypothetical protein